MKPFRLTPQQIRLASIPDGSVARVVQVAAGCSGLLSPVKLKGLLERVVERHEALRTLLVESEASRHPNQTVLPYLAPAVRIIDVTTAITATYVNQLADDERNAQFDDRTGPTVRVALLVRDENVQAFVLSASAIFADVYSLLNVVQELAALATDRPHQMPFAQYLQYADWQAGLLKTNEAAQGKIFWSRILDDLPVSGSLDHANDCTTEVSEGSVLQVTVSLDLQPLATIGEPRTVIAAAWALFLWRNTGNSTPIIAFCHHARCFPEFELMVGNCGQILPVAANISLSESVAAFVANTHEEMSKLEEWHPFIETIGNSHQPIVIDAPYILEYLNLPSLSGPLNVIPESLNSPADGCEIKLLAAADDEKVHLTLFLGTRYSASAELLRDSLVAVVEQICREPQRVLANVDAVPANFRESVTNNSRVNERAFLPLIYTINQRCLERPDALAVVCGGRHLSYGALGQCSSRIAAALSQRGAGPESIVAILMESSIDLIPTMLACWQVGAAFSVLDVNWPELRIDEALTKLDPVVIIHDSNRRSARRNSLSYNKVLEDTANTISPSKRLHSKNLAYVVFTSGTSGSVKGVMIEHQQIHNYAHAVVEEFGFASDHSFLAMTTFSADLVYTMLFGALLSGGRLHIVNRTFALDPVWLRNYIDCCGIAFAKTVPSHLLALLSRRISELGTDQLLQENGLKLALRSLNRLLLGGETIPPVLIEALSEVPFANHYGPAETAVGVLIEQSTHLDKRRVALGRPMGHCYCYVEAPGGQLALPNVPGELIIGGQAVGRGYVGEPGLTASKFHPDYLSERSGARVYKSGDLAARSIDDALYFEGRADAQLNIRGYRVEANEVADTLGRHPAVAYAHVCTSRNEANSEDILNAYVVVDEEYLESVRAAQYRKWRQSWQRVFKAAYDESPVENGPYAAASWMSSFTGEAMSDLEIREQMDSIVAAVGSYEPRTVLEIGCGTGSLLQHLATKCEHYVATDFSASILEKAQEVVSRLGLSSRVELIEIDARDIGALDGRRFDMIILNSVVQYFADPTYLEQVLQSAELLLSEEGRIFVGDVRDSRLLEPFHASAALFKSSADEPAKMWANRFAQSAELDSELCFEPNYFHTVSQRLHRINHVQVSLKRGLRRNELVCFRFDVILSTRVPKCLKDSACHDHQWVDGDSTLHQLEAELLRLQMPATMVSMVPNARLLGPVWLAAQASDAEPGGTCADLTLAIEKLPDGVEPEAFYRLGERLGYDVRLRRSNACLDRFDALFARRGQGDAKEIVVPKFDANTTQAGDVESVVTPLLKQLGQDIIPELIEICRARLPEYMVPMRIDLITHLPVGLNGKLQVSRLPAQLARQRVIDRCYVAPNGSIERVIAKIWQDSLGIECVGADDDFFGLGGHSLLAIEVVVKLEAIFQIRVPLTSFFGTAPTVRSVAEIIVQNESQPGQCQQIADLWEQIQSMSDDEVEARLQEQDTEEQAFVATVPNVPSGDQAI